MSNNNYYLIIASITGLLLQPMNECNHSLCNFVALPPVGFNYNLSLCNFVALTPFFFVQAQNKNYITLAFATTRSVLVAKCVLLHKTKQIELRSFLCKHRMCFVKQTDRRSATTKNFVRKIKIT